MWNDLRDSVRQLRRAPAFTAFALLTLALAIGANTALFGLLNALLAGDLGIPAQEELVSIYRSQRLEDGDRRTLLSYPDFESLRDELPHDARATAFERIRDVVAADGAAQLLDGEAVAGDYFDVLRVQPVRGRLFDLHEIVAASPVIVIAERVWRGQFRADEHIIGKIVRVGGAPFTIVGVAESRFRGLSLPVLMPTGYWMPITTRHAPGTERHAQLTARDHPLVQVRARLSPDANLATIEGLLRALSTRLDVAFPATAGMERTPRQFTVEQTMGVRLHESADHVVTPLAAGVLAFGAGVLLIACSNLANLLLARGTARGADVAVRVALGASRWRVIRLLLMDGLLLAIGGALLGLLFVAVAQRYLTVRPPFPDGVVIELAPRFDTNAAAFAVLLTTMTALVCGLWPSLRSSRPDILHHLAGNAIVTPRRRRAGLRHIAIVPQMALSLVLLAIGGMFLHGHLASARGDVGFDPGQTVMLSIDLRVQGYSEARGRELYRRLIAEARAHTSIGIAGLADSVPLNGGAAHIRASLDRTPPASTGRARSYASPTIGPGYLNAIGLPLLAGRDFSEEDVEGSRAVVIISRSAAATFWPRGGAVGRTIVLTAEDDIPVETEVIGVTGDTAFVRVGEAPRPTFYRPLAQHYVPRITMVARPSIVGNAAGVLEELRGIVRRQDAEIAILAAKPVAQHLLERTWPLRAAAAGLGGFGLLGLGLAATGLYGLMALHVGQRTREIGLRMALGASRGNIVRTVLRDGLLVVILGALLGAILAPLTGLALSKVLYGVSPFDLTSFTLVSAGLCGVGLVACYIPARRAAAIDPLRALHRP